MPLIAVAGLACAGAASAEGVAGFSFDCDMTDENPCRKLTAMHGDGPVPVEPSSAAAVPGTNRFIIVSDNFNDLVEKDAGHFVIATFALDEREREMEIEAVMTPQQAGEFPLYDLEGVTLHGDRLYAIGSLALHGKDPARDRWERHQFVQMELAIEAGKLRAAGLSHITSRWPNFRDWLLSRSGHAWTGEQARGRAEAEGINVEALCVTSRGNLILGFRGPLSEDGGTLALEIEPPSTAADEPVLVRRHVIPPLDVAHIPAGAPKTLRGMYENPGQPGEFYVLLGPKGYEKEAVVLAHWDARSGALSKATALPAGFVAEGIAPIATDRILVLDDLGAAVLIATEQ